MARRWRATYESHRPYLASSSRNAKWDVPSSRFVHVVGISTTRNPAAAALTVSSTEMSNDSAMESTVSTTRRPYSLNAFETSWMGGPPAARTSTEYHRDTRCFGVMPTMPPPRMYREPATTSAPDAIAWAINGMSSGSSEQSPMNGRTASPVA